MVSNFLAKLFWNVLRLFGVLMCIGAGFLVLTGNLGPLEFALGIMGITLVSFANRRLKLRKRSQTARIAKPITSCKYCGGKGWILTNNPSYRPFAGFAGNVGKDPCPRCTTS